jgi:hypothetical protein
MDERPTQELVVGSWWRRDRYEIRDGFVRPATDAQLTAYNPWERYREAGRHDLARDQPYQSLERLVKRTRYVIDPYSNRISLTAANEQAIVDWCSEWGLLGLLPHRALYVTLAPRWAAMRGEYIEHRMHKRVLVPTQQILYTTATGWRSNKQQRFPGPIVPDAPELRGELVSEKDLHPQFPPPGVIIRDLTGEVVRAEHLSESWARFFPDVPAEDAETYEYPTPFSNQFWDAYAEPLDAFIEGAVALSSALQGLSHIRPLAKTSDEDKWRVLRGRNTLHEFAAPARMALGLQEDGRMTQEWVTPSLLSSFAMMALMDLASGQPPHRCEACGTVFVSAAYQAKYCSRKCRNTAQMRRYRKKRKEGRARKGPDSPNRC